MTTKTKAAAARPPKAPKSESFMRGVIARNVENRMNEVFRESANKTMALARRTGDPGEGGVSQSTVQRIIAGANGATLETLDKIAFALDLALYQLFLPNLDAKNPQVVHGALDAERQMYQRWKRAPMGAEPSQ